MKKLLILLFLGYNLFAKLPFQSIPTEIESTLCKKLAQNSNRCENGSTIDYYRHFQLANKDLLLFVFLNEHTLKYQTYPEILPVVIDSLGHWTIGEGKTITEDIKSIHQDPLQNIWVRTLWQIEGVSPFLYHSRDAIHWKSTILPKNREVNCCFESMDKPNFQPNSIKLTFRDLSNKVVKSWEADYKSAMSSNPKWHKVPTSGRATIENNNTLSWSINKSKDFITFKNLHSSYQFSLPLAEKKIDRLYHIQFGAFKIANSIDIAKKKLNNLPYNLFTKKMSVKGKSYIKLLMGKFTSLKKAEFILSKIKKKYPKNKSIQEAFVLSTKH